MHCSSYGKKQSPFSLVQLGLACNTIKIIQGLFFHLYLPKLYMNAFTLVWLMKTFATITIALAVRIKGPFNRLQCTLRTVGCKIVSGQWSVVSGHLRIVCSPDRLLESGETQQCEDQTGHSISSVSCACSYCF